MDDIAYSVPHQPTEERPRRFICEMPCPRCGGSAKLYASDPRSHGWLRVECVAGHWGDLAPESVLIPEAHRTKHQ